MKLNLTIPALVFIILVLAFGWMWTCESKQNVVNDADNTALLEEVAEKEARIAQQDSAIALARENRTSDSLKFARRISDLNASVRHWKEEAAKVRPVVVQMSDSIPVLKAYIAATDSVISAQDSVIATQDLHLKVQSKLHYMEIGVMAQRHIQQQELTETWKTAAVDREKGLKKERRGKRFWRGAAMVLGATTAVLILTK